MKIECPFCRLTGKINEVELPDLGRELVCPRCKKGFHVDKPKAPPPGADLMNICPVCQYSTFTDELFAVCPKCGLVGSAHREKVRKQQEIEQLMRDHDVLTRSHRNPDLVTSLNAEGEPEKPSIPQTVRMTGIACIAVGLLVLFYAVSGLMDYYGKDWQAALSEPFVEPVSKTSIFFRMGFVPWLMTFYSLYFIAAAGFFLARKSGSRRDLIWAAWCGVAMGVIHELADFVNWIRISSSSPSISYIFTGVMNALFWIAIWGAPALVLVWFLHSERILDELQEE